MDKLIKQFNLPKYIKGKSFAQASKMIESKFEGMNDNISKETKMEMLQRLADAQEYMKAQQQPQGSQQQLPPEQIQMMQMMQQEPEIGMQQMMYGGDANRFDLGGYEDPNNRVPVQSINSIKPTGVQMPTTGLSPAPAELTSTVAGGAAATVDSVKPSGGGPGVGAYLGAATGVIDMVQGLGGKGLSGDATSDSLGGLAKGAMAGAAFGPWGAAIGGVVGGIGGLIGSGAAKKKMLNKQRNEAQSSASKINNEYRKGGYTNDFRTGGPGDERLMAKGILDENGIPTSGINNHVIKKPVIGNSDINFKLDPFDYNQDFKMTDVNNDYNISDTVIPGLNMGSSNFSTPSDKPSSNKEEGNKKFNPESLLRYAPVAMNAFQLFNIDKPEQESLNRIGKRYKKDYVDEMVLQNQVQNEYNNTAEALANATNGSRGALRANILGAQLNKTKALSDAYMKADSINRQQNDVAQRFNLGIDQFNIGQSNTEKDINARNRAAYDNNKSKFLEQIGDDLGDIGLEAYRRRYPEAMGTDYDHKGRKISQVKKAKAKKKAEKKARKNRK